MFGNLGEMANMMKKAKDIKKNLKNVQAELATTEYTGQSSDGAVSVTVTGDMTVKRTMINDTAAMENQGVFEALLTAAVNDALTKAKIGAQAKMKELTGGLDIPGLF